MAVNLRDVSNTTTFGVEWTQNAHNYRLTNERGGYGLMLAVQRENGEWVERPLVPSSKYGLQTPPTNVTEFEALARRFAFQQG